MDDKEVARFEQFSSAVARFAEVLDLPLDPIVRDSAIQRFEFTFDLGWKVLRAYLQDEYGVAVASPKATFRAAYQQGVIAFDSAWITMTDVRNQTVHTYGESMAVSVYNTLPEFLKLFQQLRERLTPPGVD